MAVNTTTVYISRVAHVNRVLVRSRRDRTAHARCARARPQTVAAASVVTVSAVKRSTRRPVTAVNNRVATVRTRTIRRRVIAYIVRRTQCTVSVRIDGKGSLVRVALKTTRGQINTARHVRVVNTCVRTNTCRQIRLTTTVSKLARLAVALTTRKGARANGQVTVRSGVTAVGSCRTVVVSRREVVRVVVERRRHVTAAELNCRVVMVRGARIKVTVVTARDNARGVVKIVGR